MVLGGYDNEAFELPSVFSSRTTQSGTFSPLLASSFVRKLYYLVSNQDHKNIIGWVRDGAAFEVRCPKLFETEILPKFFRHSRFQSFVRQLNFYAFKKISRERSSWVYSHEYFQREKPELLDLLRRKTYNNGGERGNSSTMLNNVAVARKRAYAAMVKNTNASLEDPRGLTEPNCSISPIGVIQHAAFYDGSRVEDGMQQHKFQRLELQQEQIYKEKQQQGHDHHEQQQQQEQQQEQQHVKQQQEEQQPPPLLQNNYVQGAQRHKPQNNQEMQQQLPDSNHRRYVSTEGGYSTDEESDADENGFTHDRTHSWSNSLRFFDAGRDSSQGNTSGSEMDTVVSSGDVSVEGDRINGGLPASPFSCKSTSSTMTDGERSRSDSGPDSPWSHLSDREVDCAKATYERRKSEDTTDTTADVTIFCLRNDPFVMHMKLLRTVQTFLKENNRVAKELEDYAEALAPSPKAARGVFHTNEVLVMRTFIQFAITKLQEAYQDSKPALIVSSTGNSDEDQMDILSAASISCVKDTVHHCAERWWSFSSMYA